MVKSLHHIPAGAKQYLTLGVKIIMEMSYIGPILSIWDKQYTVSLNLSIWETQSEPFIILYWREHML